MSGRHTWQSVHKTVSKGRTETGHVISRWEAHMNGRHENGTLVIDLVGRVDAGNAREVEAELNELTVGIQDAIIDASGLDYISSAGLRILLKLRKRLHSLSVIEASPDVLEVFDATGLSRLVDVQGRLREVSLEGLELIGTGRNGTVYRLDDDRIVKVFAKPDRELAKREQALARTAFASGVPCKIPCDVIRCGDTYGLVFEMAHSDTLSHAFVTHPGRMDELVDQYVEFVQTLHAAPMPKGTLPDVRDHMRACAHNLDRWCADNHIDELVSIIDAIPVCDTIFHGRLHPNNIMMQGTELVLIDLGEVTAGPKALDLAVLYRDMIAGPQTHPTYFEMTIGMPTNMIQKVAERFFAKYTGITDPDGLRDYLDQIGLIFAFNTVLLFGSDIEIDEDYAPHALRRLLGPVVFSNKQAIPHLISTL